MTVARGVARKRIITVDFNLEVVANGRIISYYMDECCITPKGYI